MSADPFANTTTVKNILQHIISPKLVTDGSGGYVSKTDLVNVHNIVFAEGASNEDGTITRPFTTQCGSITRSAPSIIETEVLTETIYHTRVTTNSVIFVNSLMGGTSFVYNVVPTAPGIFVVTFIVAPGAQYRLGWFIARF